MLNGPELFQEISLNTDSGSEGFAFVLCSANRVLSYSLVSIGRYEITPSGSNDAFFAHSSL